MRRLLAEIAFALAEWRADQAERAELASDRRRLLDKSEWWTDAEAWIIGLGGWRDLRDARARLRRKAVRP
ncbi:MAG: hypothetical protein AB7F22_10430 [Reyranella sp.]|uniref:hypothetical protein n=1 Tax=Reyranella sp. TaxID=1929291 RepID=UPI003D0A1A5D